MDIDWEKSCRAAEFHLMCKDKEVKRLQNQLRLMTDAYAGASKERDEAVTENDMLRQDLDYWMRRNREWKRAARGWKQRYYGVRAELQMEQDIYCDKPEDRLWHASDRTWWKRVNGRLVHAGPPDS